MVMDGNAELLVSSTISTDSESIFRLYLSKLAEATVDPVWLANELSSEGLLNAQTRNDLITTTGVSAHNKAIQLWSQIETIVKFHENPRRALLTVCNVMKQRAELAPLAKTIISQLMPHEQQTDTNSDSVKEAIEIEDQPPDSTTSGDPAVNPLHTIKSTPQIKGCYLVSVICFVVAIALDFFLVPESEIWRRAKFFSYPLMVLVLIGMIKSFKNFLSIGIFQILAFGEIWCLAALFETCVPRSDIDELKCDLVTILGWLIKFLCKVKFYAELIGYFRLHINAKWFMILLVIFSSHSFVTCLVMIDVFQSKGNTVTVFFIAITLLCGLSGLKLTQTVKLRYTTTNFLTLLFVVGLLGEFIINYILKYYNANFIIIKAIFSALQLFFLCIVNCLYDCGVYIILAGVYGMSLSDLIYVFQITYNHNDTSLVLVVFSFLLLASCVLIFVHYQKKSIYPAVFSAVFFLFYDLFLFWHKSLTISTVTQTLCQLGALIFNVADNYRYGSADRTIKP